MELILQKGHPRPVSLAPADGLWGSSLGRPGVSGRQMATPPPKERRERAALLWPAALLPGLSPPPQHATSIALVHADVKVAAEDGSADDAVGNLVVGRGVFVRCLEARVQTGPVSPQRRGLDEGGWEGSTGPLGVPALGDPGLPCPSAGCCPLAPRRHTSCRGVEAAWESRRSAGGLGERGKVGAYPEDGEGHRHPRHDHLLDSPVSA